MLEPMIAADAWRDELPASFSALVVAPLRYETHVDEAAQARKLVGLDADGRRCFLRHTHTLVEQRFDIDEFPVDVPVLHERQLAWRLRSGRWLHLVERLDHLQGCRPRHVRWPPALVTEAGLGL